MILKYIIVTTPAIPRHIINIITITKWFICDLSSSLITGTEDGKSRVLFEFIELLELIKTLELELSFTISEQVPPLSPASRHTMLGVGQSVSIWQGWEQSIEGWKYYKD